jgi:A/G-specific adenine glycosylase
MEVGALICTARSPRCADCPVLAVCAWRRAGSPPRQGPARRPQAFAGTDRQVRGLLLDVLRGCEHPVAATALDRAWPDERQRARALAGLVSDGLVQPLPDGRFALPGSPGSATGIAG